MAGFDDSFFELPKYELIGPGAGPRPWDPPERTQPLRLDVELVRAPAVDVRLNEFVHGRDGFGFTLRIDWTDPKHEYVRDVFDVSLEADEPVPMAPPASMIRFGVAYADGAKSTNLDGKWDMPAPQEPPVLVPRGGGHISNTDAAHGFWVWPTPQPGPVTFVVAWPLEDIRVVATEVDASSLVG